MAILPLVYLPDARLREPSKPIERIDEEVRRLAADMFATMYHKEGLGLAAVQIGVHRRMLVLDLPKAVTPKSDGDEETPESNPLVLINPTIVSLGDDRRVHEEGCLSIPELRVEIERPASLVVAYTDEHGAARELAASGLLATAIQHEIDHLDGKLIIDFLSKLRRDMVIRKFKKMAKSGEFDDG
jgi:peptide deformylase